MTALNPISAGPIPASPPSTPLTPASSSGGGLSFGDILDTINPLQHIPILSGLYHAATGGQISGVAQVAGDALFGALLPGGAIGGLISSAADVAVKAVTGQSPEQLVVGAVTSATSSSPAAASTPLTPLKANVAALPASVPAIPLQHNPHTDRVAGQYQRAQALDSINKKLVKLAV